MQRKARAFYAFPSRPLSHVETIEAAIKEVGKSRKLRVKSWTSLSIVGRLIIKQITDAIQRTDLFACDLTYMNPNVVFELGYAIGSFKPIWISLNASITNARENYKAIHPSLVSVGYAPYVNSTQLASALIGGEPWNHLGEHLLGANFTLHEPRTTFPSLLYLNSPVTTDASVALTDQLQNSFFSRALTIDDPKDNAAAPLSWYAERIRDSDAVVAHLLGSHQIDSTNHNIKCALVCGLAVAFGRDVLMLAHDPFRSALDYQHLLKVHETAAECKSLAQNWLKETEPKVPAQRPGRYSTTDISAHALDLRRLSAGEPAAENEQWKIDDYFLETAAYHEALRSQKVILVGRRGTGKTANFYSLRTELSREPHGHVCAMKPVGYDIDGVVRVLGENLERSERGYLVESLLEIYDIQRTSTKCT